MAREEAKPAGVLSQASKAISKVNVRPQPESGSKLTERERDGGKKETGRGSSGQGGWEREKQREYSFPL